MNLSGIEFHQVMIPHRDDFSSVMISSGISSPSGDESSGDSCQVDEAAA
jgi:hypothetical protein